MTKATEKHVSHGVAAGAQSRPDPQVWHYCPGGREHGGGIGRMVGYIADAGQRVGYQTRVIDSRGARWNWLSSPARLLATIVCMAWSRVVAPGRIHHIHIAGRGSTVRKLILTAVARLLGMVHVLHLHDYDYAADMVRRPRWLRRWIVAMFRGADRVLVLGRKDRNLVVQDIGVASQRVVILPNSVPDPGLAGRFSGSAPPRILFLGRLSERKGVPELLLALSRAEMADLPWCAVLAGDGPVDLYRRQAATLGLQDRVTLPGWLDEKSVRDLCAASDILALPSQAEGMAMAVLEGLAHGLAVVTTRVGAHEEVLVDGANGLFVPIGDVEALAKALSALTRDHALRDRLARAGRKTFEERFEIDSYLRRLGCLYDSLQQKRFQAAGAV